MLSTIKLNVKECNSLIRSRLSNFWLGKLSSQSRKLTSLSLSGSGISFCLTGFCHCFARDWQFLKDQGNHNTSTAQHFCRRDQLGILSIFKLVARQLNKKVWCSHKSYHILEQGKDHFFNWNYLGSRPEDSVQGFWQLKCPGRAVCWEE
jgi:hypothetical protein